MEDRINNILHKLNIIREIWYGGTMTGFNCRWLLRNYCEILSKMKKIFIEMNKEVVFIEKIEE